MPQISMWMIRLQHRLRLHRMPKLLRMHQLLKLLRMHKLLKLKQLNHQGMKWRVKQHHYIHQKNHLSSLGWNYRLGGGHDSSYKPLSYFLEFLRYNFLLMYCILIFLKLCSISLLSNIDVVHFDEDELMLWI